MKINKKSTKKFWDKTDRLMVVTVGGAALGDRLREFMARLLVQY